MLLNYNSGTTRDSNSLTTRTVYSITGFSRLTLQYFIHFEPHTEQNRAFPYIKKELVYNLKHGTCNQL